MARRADHAARSRQAPAALGLERDDPTGLTSLTIAEPPAGEPSVEVRRAETLDDSAWRSRSTGRSSGSPEEERELRRARGCRGLAGPRGRRHVELYLAYLDGEPVGFGRTVFTPLGGLLLGGATLPEARGQGVYTSLVHARWDEAVAARRAAARRQRRPGVGADPRAARLRADRRGAAVPADGRPEPPLGSGDGNRRDEPGARAADRRGREALRPLLVVGAGRDLPDRGRRRRGPATSGTTTASATSTSPRSSSTSRSATATRRWWRRSRSRPRRSRRSGRRWRPSRAPGSGSCSRGHARRPLVLVLHERRRRGERERDQARALVHGPPQDHRALPQLPRRDRRRDHAHRRPAPLAGRARASPASCGCSTRTPTAAPRAIPIRARSAPARRTSRRSCMYEGPETVAAVILET